MNVLDFVCGILVGIALVGLITSLRALHKSNQRLRESEMRSVAQEVLRKARDDKSIAYFHIFGFEEKVNSLIQEYMDEKEADHDDKSGT